MASQVESLKWVAGRFIVDGFAFCNPRCSHYFLTHFHSDHTVGLGKTGARGLSGTIYCTSVTRSLLLKDMGLAPGIPIEVLEYEQPRSVDGVRVTALPANHCPGACLLLFEVPRGEGGPPETILHTGDFRWQSWMAEVPCLKRLQVDTLYLDTTYAHPRYTLPPQERAIDDMAREMREALAREPQTLFVMAAYHIGKEKAFFGAAKRLGCKVWVNPKKRRVLQLLQLPPDDMALLADSPADAQLHVVGGGIRHDKLHHFLTGPGSKGRPAGDGEGGGGGEAVGQGMDGDDVGEGGGEAPWQREEGGFGREVRARAEAAAAQEEDVDEAAAAAVAAGSRWKHVMGIKATGWTFRKNGRPHVWRRGPVSMLSVPYSEHSGWGELCDCVRTLRPKALVPTVNVETQAKYNAMVDKFAHLMHESYQCKDKSRIRFYFSKLPAGSTQQQQQQPSSDTQQWQQQQQQQQQQPLSEAAASTRFVPRGSAAGLCCAGGACSASVAPCGSCSADVVVTVVTDEEDGDGEVRKEVGSCDRFCAGLQQGAGSRGGVQACGGQRHQRLDSGSDEDWDDEHCSPAMPGSRGRAGGQAGWVRAHVGGHDGAQDSRAATGNQGASDAQGARRQLTAGPGLSGGGGHVDVGMIDVGEQQRILDAIARQRDREQQQQQRQQQEQEQQQQQQRPPSRKRKQQAAASQPVNSGNKATPGTQQPGIRSFFKPRT